MISETAKVSILINCYNGERWLRSAIDSVYSQAYKNWEIIFIDNCSDDGSAQIARSYDYRIKYYKTEKTLSLGAARNLAMGYVTGKYLAFLDVDDLWLPKKLLLQVEQLENNKDSSLCYAGNYFINEKSDIIGKRLPESKTGYVFPSLLKYYDVNWQTVILRFDSAYCFFKEDCFFAEDYEIIMRVASEHMACVLPEVLVKYRIHDGSQTKKLVERHWIEQKMVLDGLLDYDPLLKLKYPREFELAYAKVWYYKALHEYYIKNDKVGRVEMKKVRFKNSEYFMLYILSLMPFDLWRRVHRYLGKVLY